MRYRKTMPPDADIHRLPVTIYPLRHQNDALLGDLLAPGVIKARGTRLTTLERHAVLVAALGNGSYKLRIETCVPSYDFEERFDSITGHVLTVEFTGDWASFKSYVVETLFEMEIRLHLGFELDI